MNWIELNFVKSRVDTGSGTVTWPKRQKPFSIRLVKRVFHQHILQSFCILLTHHCFEENIWQTFINIWKLLLPQFCCQPILFSETKTMIKQESCGTTETNKSKDYKDTFQYCFVSILWGKALTTKTLKTEKRKRGNTTCIARIHKRSTNKKMKNLTNKYTKVLQHAIQGDINDLQCAVARFRVLQVIH